MADDFSELDKLIADISEIGVRVAVEGLAIVTKGAHNVMTDARSFAPSGPYTPHYPASITYDVEITSDRIAAEIGPDKDKPQGALGNIFEYGTGDTPAQAHLGPAHDREVPRFNQQIDRLGGRLL